MESLGRASTSDDLVPELVLHVENDAGEKGAVADIVDDDALDGDVEPQEDAADQVVGQGALLLDAVQGHGNRVADAVIDIDHEGLVLIAEKDGAAIRGRHDPLDGDFNDLVLHGRNVRKAAAKRKPAER